MIKLIKKEFQSLEKWVLGVLILALIIVSLTSFYNFENKILKLNDGWKWIGFFSAVFSILNVCLIANRKLSNFFYGALSCIFYSLYCYKHAYYGDLLLNIGFYLPMIFYGFYKWKKGYSPIKMKIIKNKWDWLNDTPILILMSITLYALWFFITPFIGDIKSGYSGYGNNYAHLWTWRHYADAFTSMGGMVSTYYLNARLPVDNIYYLLMNPASIAMWSYYGDPSMIITYSVYMLFAVIGIYDWFWKK